MMMIKGCSQMNISDVKEFLNENVRNPVENGPKINGFMGEGSKY